MVLRSYGYKLAETIPFKGGMGASAPTCCLYYIGIRAAWVTRLGIFIFNKA
jgi:hypothetical protein